MEGLEADAYRRLLDLDLANTPLSQIGTGAVRAALSQWDGRKTSEKVRTKVASVSAACCERALSVECR
jgi:hypothetical protein